jgi:hypothetical protein
MARCAALVGAAEQLVPGGTIAAETEAVLQPPALAGLAATLDERVPEPVDLRLILARHGERHRLGERKLGAAVERRELLARQAEGDRHHLAGRPWRTFGVSRDAGDLGVGEERDVEVRRLLGLTVEPQERGDILHRDVLLALVVGLRVGFAINSSRRSKPSFRPVSMPDCSMPSRSSTDWNTEFMWTTVEPSTSSKVAVSSCTWPG